mgnify:CR=1 FL=1
MATFTLLEWVEALESGDYPQGRLRLRKHGKHCCLGVACVVAGVESYFETAGNSDVFCFSEVFSDSVGWPIAARGLLNAAATKWESSPNHHVGLYYEVMDMNDSGKSFAEIAQRIRECCPDLSVEITL